MNERPYRMMEDACESVNHKITSRIKRFLEDEGFAPNVTCPNDYDYTYFGDMHVDVSVLADIGNLHCEIRANNGKMLRSLTTPFSPVFDDFMRSYKRIMEFIEETKYGRV
jgi:hypothetical protein